MGLSRLAPSCGKGAAACLLAVLAVRVTGAQPLLLADSAFVHGSQAATRPEATLPLRAAVPSDWTAPVAYAGGTVHFRLEILHKPTGTAIRYQPCLERGASRACAAAQLLSDSGATRAVYAWSQPLAQWSGSGMSWSSRPDRFVLILQDAYGRPVTPAGTGWVGQPFLSLYYPLSVRFSAAIVASGTAFPGWPGIIPVTIAPGRPAGRAAPDGALLRAGGGGTAAVMAARGPRGWTDMRGRRVIAGGKRGG